MKKSTVAMLLALLLAADAAGADDPAERATLKDLAGIRVFVADPGKIENDPSLARDTLRTAVEEKLRAAGVSLLGENERARGGPQLTLDLRVSPVDDLASAYIYSLELSLIQEVRLIRAPNIRLTTTTWSTPGAVGIVESDKLSTLRVAADTAIDSFVAAWRAANVPK